MSRIASFVIRPDVTVNMRRPSWCRKRAEGAQQESVEYTTILQLSQLSQLPSASLSLKYIRTRPERLPRHKRAFLCPPSIRLIRVDAKLQSAREAEFAECHRQEQRVLYKQPAASLRCSRGKQSRTCHLGCRLLTSALNTDVRRCYERQSICLAMPSARAFCRKTHLISVAQLACYCQV